MRGQSGGLFFALKIAFVQRPARWEGFPLAMLDKSFRAAAKAWVVPLK